LFGEFRQVFRRVFTMKNLRTMNINCFHNFDDQDYAEFMLSIFNKLNPYLMRKDFYMQYELDDVNRVVFFMNGMYKIGYEVNKIEYYKLRQGKGTIMGAYECFFNKRSVLLYRSYEEVTGMFITKPMWKELEREFPYFMGHFKRFMVHDYLMKYSHLSKEKDKLIA